MLCAGFVYSDKCPRQLTSQLSECRSHIDVRRLLFHSQNALVAKGPVKHIAQACRSVTGQSSLQSTLFLFFCRVSWICLFSVVCHEFCFLPCVMRFVFCRVSWVLFSVVWHEFWFSVVCHEFCFLSCVMSFVFWSCVTVLFSVMCHSLFFCRVSWILLSVMCHEFYFLSLGTVLFSVMCHVFYFLSCVMSFTFCRWAQFCFCRVSWVLFPLVCHSLVFYSMSCNHYKI